MYVQTLAIWPILLVAVFALVALAAGIWAIVRFARSGHLLLIPVTLLALVGLGGALLAGVYFARLEVHEDARRAQARQELERLSLAVHEHRAAESMPRVIVESERALPSQVLDFRGESEGLEDVPIDTETLVAPPSASSSLELVSYVGGDVAGERLMELPEWVDDQPEVHPLIDEQRHVLVSDQWATLEEADAQLTQQAAEKLEWYLAKAYPSARGWVPDAAAIAESGAVTRRVHETSTLPIGEFNPTLYRMYWELELTPDVRAKLLDAWRPFAVQQRVTWLGVGLGVLTLVFAALGTLLRRGSRPHQREQAAGPAMMA